MLLSLLGLLDIIAGLYVIFNIKILALYIGIFVLIKSISSLIGGIKSPMILIMGIIDLLVALNIIYSWHIPWVAILILIKGVYSLIVGMI
ncbi:MAG: hypothetical protein J7K26_01125 [Candidatus Aenigmarchaeota archaeon]|nr:hypothetical protein [Candidatus Aenigmarchaeota archaeon]